MSPFAEESDVDWRQNALGPTKILRRAREREELEPLVD